MALDTSRMLERWRMSRRESELNPLIPDVSLPTSFTPFRSRKYQTWGSGVSVVSHDDRREIKKARKEGRISEAMLDRRAKLKQ